MSLALKTLLYIIVSTLLISEERFINMYLAYAVAKFSILAVISLCVLICYSIWTVKVIKHLKQSIATYRVHKRMDYRDIREQNRILYNHETHIVKDLILLIICIAEMGEPVMSIIVGVVVSYYNGLHDRVYYPPFNTTASLTPCTFIQTVEEINMYGYLLIFTTSWYMYFISLIMIGCIIFFLLLSFLTQYLSKRYFIHPIRKTCIIHIALALIQISIISCLTNRDTSIFYLFIVPIMILIDWCILVRNCRILFRVLQSNVRDLKLNLSNRYLYIEQWKLLQVYKILIPILLSALFFGVCVIFLHFYFHIVSGMLWSHCFNLMIGDGYTYTGYNKVFAIERYLYLLQYSTFICMIIHFILLGFPMFAISVGMLYSACVKRCSQKESDYRFNYDNFRAALLRNNLRPPY